MTFEKCKTCDQEKDGTTSVCDVCKDYSEWKSKNLMICPSCKGEKTVMGLFPVWADNVPQKDRKLYVYIPCPDCNKTGKVDDRYPEWLKIGKEMAEDRRKRRLTIFKEAKRRNIDSIILSKMERGFIEPIKE